MKRTDLVNCYNQLGSQYTEIDLFFIHRERSKRKKSVEYQIFVGALSGDVSDELTEVLTSQLHNILWRTVREKDPDSKSGYSKVLVPKPFRTRAYRPDLHLSPPDYPVLALANSPELTQIINGIERCDRDDGVTVDKKFLRDLWAYAVGVTYDDQCVYYFRRFTPSKVLSHGGILNYFFDGTMLSKIKDDVFNFDERVDVIVIRNEALILQKHLFEEIFSMGRVYVEGLNKVKAKLRALDIIDKLNAFVQACAEDQRKARKLVAIGTHIDRAPLDRDQLYEVSRRGGAYVRFDSKGRIVFEKDRVWEILQLLDDDFLESPVTTMLYEAHSKTPIPEAGGLGKAQRKVA